MIKLLDILENKILVTRRSPEERSKNYNITLQKKIQQYMKDGGKGDLDLSNTPITSLPNGLKVGGYLNLYNTLLSKKYSEDKIRQMIKDRGGYVKGGIYS